MTGLETLSFSPIYNSRTRKMFDGEDRPIKVTDQAGNVTITQYDQAGRVVSKQYPDGGTVQYEYDKTR